MPETPHSTFRLSAEVRAMLDEMAESRALTRTAIVEMAVREWYDTHPRWRKARKKIRESD